MSHFSCLVIGNNVETQLAPFHEFECTGTDDQYVVDVDKTEEARAEYEKSTTRRLRDSQGKLHEPWSDQFYRDPTPNEAKSIGPIAGSGCGDGMSWSSRDWNDGRGYRTKIQFIPEGWTEEEAENSEIQSFAEWVEEYESKSIVPHGSQPDLKEKHKYGYAIADEAGNVIKVINRTNPNKKWDWWQEGGRYSRRLLLKNGTRVNTARKGDVDFFGLERDAASDALNDYLLARTCIDQHPAIETWEIIRERNGDNIQAARDEYHAQPLIKAFDEFNRKLSYKFGLDGPEEFLVTREQYLQDAVDRAFTFYSTVKDQQWAQKGEMGWFGMASNEMTQSEWNAKFKAMIAELPDDAILTVVDCHI